jgi:subtilisin family serine protease
VPRRFLPLFVGLIVILTAVPGVTAGPTADAPAARYIVVLDEDVADPATVAAQHARRFGLEVGFTYRWALKGYSATIPNARLAELRADPRVRLISEDGEVQLVAQTKPTGVNRIQADASSQASGNGSGSMGGSNKAVAVIDTGAGPHPDVNIVGGKNCSTGNTWKDQNGHGTHVAGTIGAKDNSSGVVGVAPGIKIYSVRVLNPAGSGSFSSVTCGVDWVTGRKKEFKDGSGDGDAGINFVVANISLGGSGSDGTCGSHAFHKAICNSVAQGIVYVVAAGNANANFKNSIPAAYNQVLTVTAMADFNGKSGGGAAATCRSDVDDTAADFSNWTVPGSTDAGHTIAAPGVCIRSTWKSDGYNTISGTSMAAPHVAGTVALCFYSGACGGLTPSQVIAKLRANADARSSSYGFKGDPDHPITSGGKTRYYGYLVYAGGY